MKRIERFCLVGSTPIVCRHFYFVIVSFNGFSMDSCALQSLNASEDMAGSAVSDIQRWILVEYKKSWPSRPKLDSLEIEASLKEQIQQALAIEGSRMQLIRRQPASANVRVFLYEAGKIWVSTANTKRLVPEEMLPYTDPMVLVCTHGKRDRCCGVLGGKIYARARRIASGWASFCTDIAQFTPRYALRAYHRGGPPVSFGGFDQRYTL